MAGSVMGLYGLGALMSIAGGWIGDRGSPRLVLSAPFVAAAILGYLLFNGSSSYAWQASLSFAWGVIVSGVLYVNLAGYHVKAVRRDLAGRASGVFVTSLYLSAAVAGYLMGWLANRAGWGEAGAIQISLCSLAAAALALALRPEQMSGATRVKTDSEGTDGEG
jgi:sugar phosphate permease